MSRSRFQRRAQPRFATEQRVRKLEQKLMYRDLSLSVSINNAYDEIDMLDREIGGIGRELSAVEDILICEGIMEESRP